MRSVLTPILMLCAVVFAATAARADTVILRDGTKIDGDVKRSGEGWTITTADGKTRTVSAGAVKSISLGSSAGAGNLTPNQAADQLASLRRSVEALDDVDQIIERFERFIDMTRDAAAKTEAQRDLESWQQRKAQGYIKHGTRWIQSSELPPIVEKATQQAEEARALIRENRLREADGFLKTALDSDPTNPAALYLHGVSMYRQEKFADAKKAFEALAQILPEHAPTLNNLAVVLFKQNATGVGFNAYDQAMQAQPVNKFILNNVAEAIGSLPEDKRRGSAMERVLKRFAEQDTLLQQQMSKQGLFRWGGTFVDQKKLDELKAAENEVRGRLDSMQAEFDQAKVRLETLDRQITDNDSQMNSLRLSAFYRDASGNVIALPPPPAYYDLQRQNQQLMQERDTLRAKQGTLQEQARRLRTQIPAPTFTGIQQIVGVEGTPGPMDLPVPTTLPATVPAAPTSSPSAD